MPQNTQIRNGSIIRAGLGVRASCGSSFLSAARRPARSTSCTEAARQAARRAVRACRARGARAGARPARAGRAPAGAEGECGARRIYDALVCFFSFTFNGVTGGYESVNAMGKMKNTILSDSY